MARRDSGVATLFVLIAAYRFPFPFANIAVAFSPGAQDTMMVLALAMHLDPVFVGALQLSRFLLVSMLVLLLLNCRNAEIRSGV